MGFRQLIGEMRKTIPSVRDGYEYRHLDTCNVFMAAEPLLAGWRITRAIKRSIKTDWAHFLHDIAMQFPNAI